MNNASISLFSTPFPNTTRVSLPQQLCAQSPPQDILKPIETCCLFYFHYTD